GKSVPTVSSGLSDAERQLLQSRGLLNTQGKITPSVVTEKMLAAPEEIFTLELWESIYGVPKGDITIEHIQHAFYMAANYGFQILNGNFAAAIDDYELKLRFMNDLATYRIDVSWLWTLVRHEAATTRDGWLKRPALTERQTFYLLGQLDLFTACSRKVTSNNAKESRIPPYTRVEDRITLSSDRITL